MNKIINKFLLTGDKFMAELHLKYPRVTYSACGPFTKHREKIQKFRETSNLQHLYRNKLDKACFPYDAAYSNNKDLAKKIISHKTLKDRSYEMSRNRGYYGYQRALASMVYKFFDKETGSGAIATSKPGAIATSKAGVSINEQLDKELQKPVTKKFKRRKFYTRFKDNIGEADLAEIE